MTAAGVRSPVKDTSYVLGLAWINSQVRGLRLVSAVDQRRVKAE